jgi:hypothetical protein
MGSDPARGACLAALPLPVKHQRHVMNSMEHKTAHKAAKAPIDRLSGRKILRQHPPATASSRPIANGVQNLAQIDTAGPPRRRANRKHRRDPHPFVIGQIRRLVILEISVIRPRAASVHISSLNHKHVTRSMSSQTVS